MGDFREDGAIFPRTNADLRVTATLLDTRHLTN